MAGDIWDTNTESIIRAALNGLSLRQKVVANNLANIDTPGFKASRVKFESKLAEALRSLDRLQAAPGQATTTPGQPSEADLRPETVTITNTSARQDGNNVDIDEEMIKLVETNIRYSSLVRLISARLSLMKTIASGGYR